MDYEKLAELLLPQASDDLAQFETQFPPRNLPEGAQVTRLAPSPTGFIHLGNLYSALTNERIAHQSGGVFFLRIEDTDLKRTVEGAVETVIKTLRYFDINFDEGATLDGETGGYGPYYQRQRAGIYQAFVKDLIRRGLAYPCFCTEDELTAIRQQQEAEKATPGYYGKWARCRDLTLEQVQAHLAVGDPFVIRLRSQGTPEGTIKFHDSIKGEITMPENVQDVVILKSDGIPTYHFAHAIDDHFMRTTLVVRGEEWLSSVPIHWELFHVLGFRMPKYAHTAQLMKLDGGNKRKLSKRKDPELSLDFYRRDGYHPKCVRVYLLTLLNSNFEEWYDKHPDAPIEEFPFRLSKMSQSGALFDLDKLHSICKNELAKLSLDEMKAFLRDWAEEYRPDLAQLYFADEAKLDKILTLCMGIGAKRRRKDFVLASQIMDSLHFFFDETFRPAETYPMDSETVREILRRFLETYDPADDATMWFDKVKAIGQAFGFTPDMKAYKANPDAYRGSVAHVAGVLRVAVTGAEVSPDLWTVMQILGPDVARARVQAAIDRL